MGLFNFFRGLFWKGEACSGCGRPLKMPERGERHPPKNFGFSRVARCIRCGSILCEGCQGFGGLGLVGGCKECGGHQIESFHMWILDL